MKKFLLVAFIAITGVVNAKDIERKGSEKKKEEKEKKKEEKKEAKQTVCTQYGMVAWCKPSEMVTDTVCYDSASEADYQHSRACIRENGNLYNIFMCGSSTDHLGAIEY